MTDITIDVHRNHYHVTAEGHAEDAMVCAGISVLTQTLAGCLMNHDDVKVKTFDIADGHVDLEWVSHGWKVLEDVKMMTIGLLQIEQSYPGNAKIKQNIF